MPQDMIRRVLMKLDKNYLPYEYFEKLENFKEVEVLDGVTMTKLPTSKGIYLQGKYAKGTEIIDHYHNSKEYCYVTKGRVVINGKIELVEGDDFNFKPFEIHNIKVLEECEMYMQFTKDESFKKFK